MSNDPWVPALVAIVVLWVILRPLIRSQRPVQQAGPPPNAIVVDGSNVMHWGGEPSGRVLSQVLRAIEGAGLAPILFFDANVGYILGNRYYDAAQLAKLTRVPAAHICVVPKGMTADEALLGFADHHGLRVVSNDRYRDWRVRFPYLDKRGRVLRGTYRDGNVVWRGQL